MNSKLKTLLAIILCFCTLRKYGCSRFVWTMASGKEDLELEREGQSLNKPPVKTIQLGGDVVDCICIYSQPALDNPVLKNHKIQLRPTSFPAEIKSSAPLTDPISETWSKMEACPDGTVPIHRTAKHDLERSKSLSHQIFRNISNANPLAPKTKQVFVKINYRDKVTYYGVSGSSSVYKVLLPSPDMSSAANAWVEGNNNVLMAGWMVSQSISGDDNPRLFVYWTADNGEKTGCFNLNCQGFVQTDRRVGPKSALEPVSKFGGATYDVKVTIYQDPVSGNWWLMVLNNYTIGYWPKEIVPGLQNGGGAVGWGGIAMGNENENSPPMGSGQFPDGFYDHGAYFRDIRYMVTKSLDQVTPSETDPVLEQVDGQGCYKLQNDKFTGLVIWGYRFSFGGPGGPCAR